MRKYAGWITIVLGGVLLVYSASRSFNFLAMTLPEDKVMLAYVGLAALDGGIVAWLLAYLYASKSTLQRGIAMGLIVLDFLGAVMTFVMDTLYESGEVGLIGSMPESDIKTAVLLVSLVIAINIGAVVMHHMTDPERLKVQALEDVQAQVEDEVLSILKDQASVMAKELAPRKVAAMMQQTRAEFTGSTNRILAKAKALEKDAVPVEEVMLPAPKRNGQVIYQQEVPVIQQDPTRPSTR